MWSDQQEKEYTKKYLAQIIQIAGEIKETYDQNTDGKEDLGNIGIVLNNKMVEIYQIYARNNVSYAPSALKNVIFFYLTDLTLDAINKLQEYVDVFAVNIDKINAQEETLEILAQANEKLQEYREFSDKIFAFDINRDIVHAVEKDIEHSQEIGREGGYDRYLENPAELINNYNQELESLGMTTRVPMSLIENKDTFKH